ASAMMWGFFVCKRLHRTGAPFAVCHPFLCQSSPSLPDTPFLPFIPFLTVIPATPVIPTKGGIPQV
ncbi:MAG: hypothetical protein ACOCYO_06685, partial [Bacteroidota bacterium]